MKNRNCIFLILCLIMTSNLNVAYSQIGELTIDGDMSLISGSTYLAQFKDFSGPGVGHDHIMVSGDVTLSGTLNIDLEGYEPDTRDSFEIITYDGELIGQFSDIDWPVDMLDQGWDIDYGVQNEGRVTIFGRLNSLPVEMLFFTGHYVDGYNVLNWATASELNSDYFLVEYSLDGQEFVTLEEVASNGNSNIENEYSYSHKVTGGQQYYYRLKQVDLDGIFEYSDIISIQNATEELVSFFPNPTTGEVIFTDQVAGISVYNLQGLEVHSLNRSDRSYDLSNLTSGIYFIKVNGESTSNQVIISK